MFNFFKLRSKNFLGIDVGTSSIKVVELSRKGKDIILKNYGESQISYPSERSFRSFEKNNLLLSEQEISKSILEIFQEAGISTRKVNFSIPDFSSFFTTFKLPPLREEEIPETIRYEVRPYVLLPLSEITLDWLVIEGEIGKTPLKVLVVAIPNDVINQYKEIAKISKLELQALEPEVFAMARSLKPLLKGQTEKEEKTVALIDIGAKSTTYNIFRNGTLKTSHSFSLGSNELTELLAKSLNIDYNKAEKVKREIGLKTENGEERVREILTPLIDSIIDEGKKIFREFYKNEGREIDKIVLAGGTALLPGLTDYFEEELKKKTIIANPFLGMSYPPALKRILEEMGPSYSVAVGLALKGFE